MLLRIIDKPIGNSILQQLQNIQVIALSMTLALFTCLGASLYETGQLIPFKLSFESILGAFAVYIVLTAVFCILISVFFLLLDMIADRATQQSSHRKRISGKTLCFLIFLIAICWAPIALAAWPGNVHGDFLHQLMQYYGTMPLSNHHPILMTLIIGSVFDFGVLHGDANMGLALVTVMQIVAMLSFCAFSIFIISGWGIKHKAIYALAGYYAINPLIASYTVFCVKDVPSMLMLAMFLLLAADSVVKERIEHRVGVKRWVALAALAILASLTRNSNLYLLVPALVCLPFAFTPPRISSSSFIKGCIAAFSVVLTISIWTSLIVPALGARSGSVNEALSVPLQQTASYLATYPDDITEHEREAIERLLPEGGTLEELANRYTYKISDPVKGWLKTGSRNDLALYAGSWFSMGLRHPLVYITTFMHGNFGYWYPFLSMKDVKWGNPLYAEPSSYVTTLANQGFKIQDEAAVLFDLQAISMERQSLAKELIDYWGCLPILGLLFHPAFYFWILACIGIWQRIRKKEIGALFVLCAVLFLVCCASPDFSNMRYAIPMALLIPILLFSCIAARNESNVLQRNL